MSPEAGTPPPIHVVLTSTAYNILVYLYRVQSTGATYKMIRDNVGDLQILAKNRNTTQYYLRSLEAYGFIKYSKLKRNNRLYSLDDRGISLLDKIIEKLIIHDMVEKEQPL